MQPTEEKAVPVLTYTENDAHVIALYGVGEVRSIIAGAKASDESARVIDHLGIACVVVTDFYVTPLDAEIIQQILATFIGVVGLRAVCYLNVAALEAELSE